MNSLFATYNPFSVLAVDDEPVLHDEFLEEDLLEEDLLEDDLVFHLDYCPYEDLYEDQYNDYYDLADERQEWYEDNFRWVD